MKRACAPRSRPRTRPTPGSRRWLDLLVLLLLAACSRSPLVPPRHVLLLVIDTQRADHLSCYGYHRPTSPALDALAKEGVLFRRAVSQASWTVPSMVSMMTSGYVAEEVMRIPDEKSTLAEVFKVHGWHTGAFICNDLLAPENGFQRGFDTFEWHLEPYKSNQPILDWIHANRKEPTFTYVHLNEVHDPYDPEAHGGKARWRNVKEGLPPERLRTYDEITEKLHLVEKEASLRTIEAEIGGYDDDVAYSDARIREILDAYKSEGLWDSTAVVIAADHGEGLWTRVQFPEGTRKKAMDAGKPATLVNTLQQTHGSQVAIELVHVPLIVRAPGLRPGTVVDARVENVDILPTILELCRLPVPKSAEGTSLLALADDPGEKNGFEEAVFSYTRFNCSVITQDGMQLIHPTPRGECDFALADEIYDLNRDPEARTNLLASRRELVQRLARIADKRVKAGIKGIPVKLTPAQVSRLQSLGYIDAGVVDVISEQLAAESIDELIEGIRKSTDCLVRLQRVRALKDRSLSDEQRAAIRAIAEKEISSAVKAGLEALLSR